jgi:MoaA/NifB/PqqE/SkfB family radical SAM enzyme
VRSVIFAITKSCPLRCEHCCEWDELNRRDTLSTEDLVTIVERFRALGTTQFFFSGGEPLTRMDDIVSIVQRTAPGVDFWLLTAGVGLSPRRARLLSEAGVTGICISLDHWKAERHDAFRGANGAFRWVENAARAAREAGLVVGVTLCPTRDFVTEENLERYALAASRLGAGFIQILEPRAVGHFAGKDVGLGPREHAMLDRFCARMNADRALNRMPIVVYPAFAQRRLGCQGAGMRYLYVDTDARLHACPFCRNAAGSALDPSLPERIRELRERGCPFESCAGAAHALGVESAGATRSA